MCALARQYNNITWKFALQNLYLWACAHAAGAFCINQRVERTPFLQLIILTRALVHVAGAGGRGAGGRRQPRLRGLARTHVARLREAQGRGGHQQRPEKGKTLFGLGFGAEISNPAGIACVRFAAAACSISRPFVWY
jgi:hypothetical protein